MQQRFVLFAFMVSLSLPLSHAQAQELVESHDAWRVFTADKNGKKTCYIASLPTKKEGNYSKRGEAYILVTHRNGNQDEVSVSSGYRYKENSEVTLHFGQVKHGLFTKDDLAWAYDAKGDRTIVKEMIRGRTVEARGTSWKGTFSKDTYSLKGFTAAHRKMKELCK